MTNILHNPTQQAEVEPFFEFYYNFLVLLLRVVGYAPFVPPNNKLPNTFLLAMLQYNALFFYWDDTIPVTDLYRHRL